ncbi:hypothetical protein C7974DRAFT_292919, partial [Boeremia exigua]|uniref:uncharacterized protein n=1 Tax=Boeremia exigua TaxID=749465 RepID=UPI001E8E00EA
VWYFGYGSNMKPSVMQGRGITPLEVRWARVHGYILTFDVFGLPYSEPSMASIAPYTVTGEKQYVPDVCGVAYLLSSEDFKRLVSTEGGGVAYDEIEVEGVSATEEIRMHTLVAKFPWRPNACPSKRYL